MMNDKLSEEFGRAKVKYHNAKGHLESAEGRLRKRLKQVAACEAERTQLESTLPQLHAEIERSKAVLRETKAAYLLMRRQMQYERNAIQQRKH